MGDRRTSSWSEYDKRVAEKQKAAKQIGYQPRERRTNAWKIADAEAAIEQYKANNIGLQNEQMRMEIEDRKKKMSEEEQKAKSKEMLDKLLRASFETTDSQNKKIDQRSPAFSEDQYIQNEMRKARQPVSREDALQKSDMVGKNIEGILGNAMSGKDTNLDANMSNYVDQRQQERPSMQQPDAAMLEKLKASYKDTYLPNIEKQEAEKRSRLKNEFTPQFAKEQTESMASKAGYSDSSDVVRKSGVFSDDVMTPTIGEMTSRRTQQDEARKQIEQSEDPFIKQLMGTMETFADDPKTLTALRKELGNYIAKKGIQEQGIAGKKELQATGIQGQKDLQAGKQENERWVLSEKQKHDVYKMNQSFENDIEKLGIKDKYDKQNAAIENSYKIQQKKTEEEVKRISKEPGSKDYQQAYKNINSEYMKTAKFYIDQDQQLETLNTMISDPKIYNNPAAYSAIQSRVARGLNGEVGVITEGDLERAKLDQSLLGSLNQTINKMASGKYDPKDLENVRTIIQIRKNQSDDAKRSILAEKIDMASDSYGIDPERMKRTFEPSFKNMTPTQETGGELPRKRVVPPAGKPVDVDEKTKAMRAQWDY